MRYPTVDGASLPWVTVEQMAEADRLATEVFHIELLQMMEHAGRALADLIMTVAPQGRIAVLAGAGNNGGGGLCAARHLTNRGRSVSVVVASENPGSAARHHLGTLAAMGIHPEPGPPDVSVVVDALVGYGLTGPLRGRSADLAAWSEGRTVLSLDIPSGHGLPGAVDPAVTLTLALPKALLTGLRPLYLADIGLPAALWANLDIEIGPVFSTGPILQVV